MDACAEPRLGQVAEQEFGLEDAAQVAVGVVEVILGGARDEALQGYRRSRVPAFQRRIELPHSVPVAFCAERLGLRQDIYEGNRWSFQAGVLGNVHAIFR